MCDPVTIAITGATMYSINEQTKMAARAEDERARVQAVQAQYQIEELKTQKRIERLKAKEEERERARLLQESLSTLTAYGRGIDSASLDNIKNQNIMAYDLDIGTSRFNLAMYESSVANQIQVINASKTPSQSGAIRRIGMINMATAGLTGYQDFKKTQVPGTKTTTVSNMTGPRPVQRPVMTPNNSGYTFTG